MEYKPIEFRQLCAVVRAVIQRNPTIDDAEWKAKTLETLARMGFDEPTPDALSRSMTQVEFAVRKTLGPRPLQPLTATPASEQPKQEYRFEGRTNRPAGWDLVQKMLLELYPPSANSGATSPRSDVVDLPLTEVQAVNEFWLQTRKEGADKLALLRAFAEIAIVRSIDWKHAEIRAEADRLSVEGLACFGCWKDARIWHHVIQIQHGGSNYIRNRVPLCDACHGSIHPWLKPTKRGSWTHITEWFGSRREKKHA
jgi:hypothetical protein